MEKLNHMAFFIQLFMLIAYCRIESKIYLSVMEYPIVLGKSFILYCNTSITNENQITWKKDDDVIMHYGASMDNQKYKEEQYADGVSLTISHTRVSDVNGSYTCITKTSWSQISLLPTKETFLVPLTDENVHITWNLSRMEFLTTVSFVKVFPIPKCFLNVNGLSHLVKQNGTFHPHGLFYNGTVELMFPSESIVCNDIITLMCLVGTTIFTVGNMTVKRFYKNEILLSVAKYPIVFGKSFILYCNTSITDENQITWKKEEGVIMQYGTSTNNQKYKEEHNADGVSLIISNTQVSDVNGSYTCITKSSSSKISLEPTIENFLVPLTDKNAFIVWNFTTEALFTRIIFNEVFPIPKCFLDSNDSFHILDQNVTFHQHGLLFNGTINFILGFSSPLCYDNIRVMCHVGMKQFIVGNITGHLGCRNMSISIRNTNCGWIIAGIIVPILSIFTIITILLVIRFIQQKLDSTSRKDFLCVYEYLNCTSPRAQNDETEVKQAPTDSHMHENGDHDMLQESQNSSTFTDMSRDSGYQDSSAMLTKHEYGPKPDDMESWKIILQANTDNIQYVGGLRVADTNSEESTTKSLLPSIECG